MKLYPLLLTLFSVADVALGYSDDKILQFLGDHGDAIQTLKQAVTDLQSEQSSLSSEVTSLRSENQQLVEQIQSLTKQCSCCQSCAVNSSSTTGPGGVPPLTSSQSTPSNTQTTPPVTLIPYSSQPNTTLHVSPPSKPVSHATALNTSPQTPLTSQVTSPPATSTQRTQTNTAGGPIQNETTTAGSVIKQDTSTALPTTQNSANNTTTIEAQTTTPTPPTQFPISTPQTTTQTASTEPTTETTSTQPTTITTTQTTTQTTTVAPTTTPLTPVYGDCEQALQDGRSPGIANISLGSGESVSVSCEVSSGNTYLVIQRRIDGKVSFDQNWDSYKHGFGNIDREFWLGNEYIHKLTNTNIYTLRIEFQDWAQNHRYAEYEHFQVASEAEKYRLTVGSYSGTAGDSFHYPMSQMLQHHYMNFSTPDRDNDRSPMNCALELGSGWWFNNCYSSNLNGPYLPSAYGQRKLGESQGQPTIDGTGIEWYPYRHRQYSMKRAEMKLRLAYSHVQQSGPMIG